MLNRVYTPYIHLSDKVCVLCCLIFPSSPWADTYRSKITAMEDILPKPDVKYIKLENALTNCIDASGNFINSYKAWLKTVKLTDWRGYNEDLQDTHLDPCFAAEGTCNITDEPHKLNTTYQTF